MQGMGKGEKAIRSALLRVAANASHNGIMVNPNYVISNKMINRQFSAYIVLRVCPENQKMWHTHPKNGGWVHGQEYQKGT
jgi:hypothetical protein